MPNIKQVQAVKTPFANLMHSHSHSVKKKKNIFSLRCTCVAKRQAKVQHS